jgi:hypothetical protein
MDAVRREESVINALPQAVGVKRIVKVAIGVAVIMPQRRCRHADLKCRLEILQNFAPVAFIAGAAAVTLVHDDEIEEVLRVVAVEAGAPFVLGDGLINREVHLAALDGLPVYLVARLSEGRKRLILRVVDEDIAIGQVENARAAMLACPVPQGIRKFPANLKRDDGLSSAGRKRQQNALSTLQDALHGHVDGDLLVISRRFPGQMVVRREQPVAHLLRDLFCTSKSGPQFRRCWKALQFVIEAGQEIVLNYAVPVRCIGELEAQNLRVFLGLLKPVACGPIGCFCLDDRDGKIPPITQQVVRAFLRPAYGSIAHEHDPAVSEAFLF